MNRREFMDTSCAAFLSSKKGYGEVETAFKMSAKLGKKLEELGYLGSDGDFTNIVNTSIRFMSADGGHWGDENMAIKMAIDMCAYIDNPRAAKAALAAPNSIGVDNPQNLPVYAPGGQLQVSGVPQMPNFPAGPSQPTQGIMTDSAIHHSSMNPAQPAGQ